MPRPPIRDDARSGARRGRRRRGRASGSPGTVATTRPSRRSAARSKRAAASGRSWTSSRSATPALPDYKRIVAASGRLSTAPASRAPRCRSSGTASEPRRRWRGRRPRSTRPRPRPPRAPPSNSRPSAYAAALKLAACQPTVTGVLFDRLVDGSQAGAQDGLFYPDGSAKASLSPLKPLLAQARRGTIAVCPGLGAQVARDAARASREDETIRRASAPGRSASAARATASTSSRSTARRAGCRCLRRAARSARAGRLPRSCSRARRLPAGAYRFTVRLVSRVNPGPLFAQRGPVFRVGS